MERPDQRLAPGGGGTVQRRLGCFNARLAFGRVGADRVIARQANRHAGPRQAQHVETLAPNGIIGYVKIENGNFHGVVTDRLDLLQHGHRGIFQRIAPEQQIHSEAHGILSSSLLFLLVRFLRRRS